MTKDGSILSGTRLANIPRNSAHLLNVYEFQDDPAKGFGLGLGVKYVDECVGQTSPAAYDLQGYGVVDLLSVYQVNEQVRLKLEVKTLFNEAYKESAVNFYAYPGASRTVQAGISYRF